MNYMRLRPPRRERQQRRMAEPFLVVERRKATKAMREEKARHVLTQRRLDEVLKQLSHAEALSIRIQDFPREFGELIACQVTLRPAMFRYGFFGGSTRFENVSRYAGEVAAEVARKTKSALICHFEGNG